MVEKKKISYFNNNNTFDEVNFKETLGSLGTTTVPGGNQLSELKKKIREGVKHVELHLNSSGKGQFGTFDVPGKYGKEARRAIANLAKLNKQTLSVHASLDFGNVQAGLNFSGIGQGGVDDANKTKMLAEADETVKFAAETAKGGAIVFHANDPLVNEIGINFAKDGENVFRENPLKESIIDKIQKYKKIADESKKEKEKEKILDELRNYTYTQPKPIFTGDVINSPKKDSFFIDFNNLLKLSDKEKEKLKEKTGVNVTELKSEDDITKVFENQEDLDRFVSTLMANNFDDNEVKKAKEKIFFDYESFLFNKLVNNDLKQVNTYELDKEFYEKDIDWKLKQQKILEKEIKDKYEIFKDRLNEIKKLEKKQRDLLKKLKKDKSLLSEYEKVSNKLAYIKQNEIGLQDYELLSKKDQILENIYKTRKELEKQKNKIYSVPEKIKEETSSSLGYLGLKALKYQYELKEKAEKADDDSLSEEERKKYRFYKDYKDIDPEKNPLYVAPENMPAGYGMFTNLDELKEVVIKSREEFANKLINDPNFEDLKKKLGINGNTEEDKKKAMKIAEKHIAATFDNAHAATYFKYYKPEDVSIEDWNKMSQESRWERFNKWLNEKASKLAEEGIIRHIHFNDTTAVDDDHNLLGQGIYDLEDLRERLRKAGVRESFIVEAGQAKSHMLNAFELFNVNLTTGSSYLSDSTSGTDVKDWLTIKEGFYKKDRYDSTYGMSKSLTFQRDQNSNKKIGGWSGFGFI